MRKSKVVRLLAVMLSVLLFASLVSGCGKKDTPIDSNFGTYEWEYGKETVPDSSKLTAWNQSDYEIVAWNASGGDAFSRDSEDDVVSREIKRVTGVSINTAKSFTNQGANLSGKLTQVIMSKDKPEVAFGSGAAMSAIIAENTKSGGKLLYDLTDYIDKYCPTIKARMPESVWSSMGVNGGEKGKVYAIPFGLGDVGLSTVDPTAEKEKTIAFEYLHNYYNCVYVREDILKALYPNAHTYAELQDIYNQGNGFTKEELYDVPITSKAQFYDFLEDIADYVNNDIATNGSSSRYKLANDRKVMPILAADGSDWDNWSWGTGLIPSLIGANGVLNTMHSYWDAKEKKVKNMLLQPFFQEVLEEWRDFIKEEKICDGYGFQNKHDRIQQEMNRGYWAVAYPNTKPDNDTAKLDNGEEVKYRKVWLQIPIAENFEFFAQGAPVCSSIAIFKNEVSENRLPQILRWLDYQCSTLADKLYGWGPETAGLYTEDENGVRQFKDEALANQMVYETGSMGKLVQKYNLSNTTLESARPIFPFFRNGGSKYHPKCYYDLSQMPELMDSFYTPAVVDPDNDKELVNIYRRACTWQNLDTKDMETLWAKRSTIESAISSVLLGTATYDSLVQTCKQNGWGDNQFDKLMTDRFLELNEPYLKNFKKGATK